MSLPAIALLAACALLTATAGCSEFPATDVGVVGDQTALACAEGCEAGERCDAERNACVPCAPGSACALPPVPDAGDDDNSTGSPSSGSGGSGDDEIECEVESGECQPCTTASTCEDGLECLDGLCRECIQDGDCDLLEVCDRGSCEEADE